MELVSHEMSVRSNRRDQDRTPFPFGGATVPSGTRRMFIGLRGSNKTIIVPPPPLLLARLGYQQRLVRLAYIVLQLPVDALSSIDPKLNQTSFIPILRSQP